MIELSEIHLPDRYAILGDIGGRVLAENDRLGIESMHLDGEMVLIKAKDGRVVRIHASRVGPMVESIVAQKAEQRTCATDEAKQRRLEGLAKARAVSAANRRAKKEATK